MMNIGINSVLDMILKNLSIKTYIFTAIKLWIDTHLEIIYSSMITKLFLLIFDKAKLILLITGS